MTTHAPSPVHRSIRVPVAPARAFEIFTGSMRDWWHPSLSVNPTRAPIADIILEPQVGGRWYERGTDGSEWEWARVLVWEPARRLVVDWHPEGRSTEVEVCFDGPAPRATNVTLIHRGFEHFGEGAEHARAMHDDAWRDLLGRFTTMVEEHGPVHPDDLATGRAGRVAARAVTDGDTILATVDIPAAPVRIFRALTTVETEQWWGAPDTYRVTEWQSDLRVGGRWSLVVRLPDGGVFPAGGEYLHIDAPHRVTLTRHYDFDYPELGRRDTTVTYRLDPIRTGTRVTVRQDGFAGLRGAADHHAEGWVGFLDYLVDHVRAEAR